MCLHFAKKSLWHPFSTFLGYLLPNDRDVYATVMSSGTVESLAPALSGPISYHSYLNSFGDKIRTLGMNFAKLPVHILKYRGVRCGNCFLLHCYQLSLLGTALRCV